MLHSLLRTPVGTSLILFLTLFFSGMEAAAQIKLAWDPNTEPDMSGYKLYYGTSPRDYGSSVDLGMTTTYTVPDLTPGVTYYFSVTAYDTSHNESTYSNEVHGVVMPPPPETVSTPNMFLGPTSGLTGTSYAYTAGGSYSSVGDGIEYQFDWTGDGTNLSPWGSATQSYSWTSPGTYSLRARARCQSHISVISGWVGPFPVSITASASLDATLLSPSGTITTSTPTYTWGAVPGSTGYILLVQDNSGGLILQSWYTASDTGCPSGTGTCSATPGTQVSGAATWWIRTLNSAGNGPWSQAMNFAVYLP